jgi:hypothetical protein
MRTSKPGAGVEGIILKVDVDKIILGGAGGWLPVFWLLF